MPFAKRREELGYTVNSLSDIIKFINRHNKIDQIQSANH